MTQPESTPAARSGRTRRPAALRTGATTLFGAVLLCVSVGTWAALPAAADGSGSTTTTAPSGFATTTAGPGTTGTTPTSAGVPASGRGRTSGEPDGAADEPRGGSGLDGVGSSFAAPAVETWTKDVANAPYNLNVNYSSTNSGDGRYEFTNETTDFAVSDIGYVGNTDTTPPSFPFIFVPITAGGIAFMYNIPGLTKNLQLSAYTACAVLTGGITNWNNSDIAQDNPGVSLPNLPIVPVTESDSAGTNYVLEEWCIDEEPALWAAFAQKENTQSGGPTDGVSISPTAPSSNWPGISGGIDDQTTTAVAGDIATNPGAIGAVQEQYATDLGFGGSNLAKGVAAVKNASGDYTRPTSVDVASALAYATQQPNGTHELNFNGAGPHVYNPSTYSYLLTPTTGWNTSKGATMSAFVNYVLTLGQQKAASFNYASLGLSLEQYGVNAVTLDVPGAVAPTAAEKQAYACGDLTPTEVQEGQTTPTCGVTVTTQPPPPPNAGNGGTSKSSSSGSSSGTSSSHSTGSSSGTAASDASDVSAGVSLTGSSSMAFTGANPLPLTVLGALLVAVGWLGRRRHLHRLRRAGGGG